MQEIKDEDRIIGKICRGELSFDRGDIKDLENGNLSIQEEESFIKLAEEIKETVKRNQKIRNEMKEKVAFVEKSDYIVRRTLSKIDNQIEDLKYQYSKQRFTPGWKIVVGTLFVLILGLAVPLTVSLFTSSLLALGVATFGGFFTGVGIDLHLIVKNQNKCEKLQKQIKDLEKARLEIISDGVDETNTQENEIKMNIIKNIYKAREEEKQHVDILDL